MNPEVIEKIIEVSEIDDKSVVVEVGPGFGVLTTALTEIAKQVWAFEIEQKLKPYWDARQIPNLKIIWGDVLKEAGSIQLKKYKVIANLPYQITSNVIRKFLESENPPEMMVLMVQKEVAERICALPGDMSLLSVAVQYYASAEIIAGVSRDNFWPIPQVDSAVIKLKVESYQVIKSKGDVKRFFDIVRIGFANRRKLLFKNLKALSDMNATKLNKIFDDLGFDATKIRAQELSVGDWEKLVEKL